MKPDTVHFICENDSHIAEIYRLTSAIGVYLHRTDVPALIYKSGIGEWWVNDIYYTSFGDDYAAPDHETSMRKWAKAALLYDDKDASEESVTNHLRFVFDKIVQEQI